MRAVRFFDLRRQAFVENPQEKFVLALGNFDGVHAAHQFLLLRAARLGRTCGYRSAAWCFAPPSSVYLGEVSQLSTLEEKLDMLAECGLDYACLADFPSLRDLSPADFTEKILKQLCGAERAVCGFHFRFGKGGAGDALFLQKAFGEDCVDVLPPICLPLNGRETVASASAVRGALLGGDVQSAKQLLGRPYSLTMPVVHGKALGRTIGIPTINQNVPEGKMMPSDGIYATRVWIDGAAHIGVSNIGRRPTVDCPDAPLNCETHILDFDCDLYEKSVRIEFLQRLRDEQRFGSLDELKAAVQGDIAAARQYFNP